MPPIKKENYSAQIVRFLCQRIRSGKLACGQKISEAAIAEECGISRAPVREALQQMESEGIIMPTAKRGKCVAIVTRESIFQRYELCGLLEGAIAVKVAEKAREKALSRLEEVLQKMETAVHNKAAFEDHAQLGTDFHNTLVSLEENTLLANLSRTSCRVVSKVLMYQKWRTLYTVEELYRRHYSIYEAIRNGAPDEIRRAVQEHYADSATRLAALCEEPRPRKKPERRKAHIPEE